MVGVVDSGVHMVDACVDMAVVFHHVVAAFVLVFEVVFVASFAVLYIFCYFLQLHNQNLDFQNPPRVLVQRSLPACQVSNQCVVVLETALRGLRHLRELPSLLILTSAFFSAISENLCAFLSSVIFDEVSSCFLRS